jgi:hypothetical protein
MPDSGLRTGDTKMTDSFSALKDLLQLASLIRASGNPE